MSLLPEGTKAPEFTLSLAPEQKISLADYRGRTTVLVIDPAGTVRWSYLSPLGVNPGADGILDALESLKAKV